MSITMRFATQEDAADIFELMTSVYEQLEDKALFVCDDYEFVCNHITRDGFIVVAVDGNRIVGSLIVRYPLLCEDNLGRDIGLSDIELLRVAHMESACVLSLYRGMNIQKKLMKYAIEVLTKSGKIDYIMGTVAPANFPSIISFERLGFTKIATKMKYSGRLRHIYQMQL